MKFPKLDSKGCLLNSDSWNEKQLKFGEIPLEYEERDWLKMMQPSDTTVEYYPGRMCRDRDMIPMSNLVNEAVSGFMHNWEMLIAKGSGDQALKTLHRDRKLRFSLVFHPQFIDGRINEFLQMGNVKEIMERFDEGQIVPFLRQNPIVRIFLNQTARELPMLYSAPHMSRWLDFRNEETGCRPFRLCDATNSMMTSSVLSVDYMQELCLGQESPFLTRLSFVAPNNYALVVTGLKPCDYCSVGNPPPITLYTEDHDLIATSSGGVGIRGQTFGGTTYFDVNAQQGVGGGQ